MTRIAFIGAGSIVFARRLIINVLSFPELRETTFALMDIDAERLDLHPPRWPTASSAKAVSQPKSRPPRTAARHCGGTDYMSSPCSRSAPSRSSATTLKSR